MNLPPLIVGIGEVLWDVFPDGVRFGGAPANFACHAAMLGADSWLVSAVGEDCDGRRALARLAGHGVHRTAVIRDPRHATGSVQVQLDAAGQPSYDIREDVAWDHLPWSPALDLLVRCDAVCFGSLAQRSPLSRETIQGFLDAVPRGALRVFDVNLRQHFYSPALLRASLEKASVLKLNDAELPVLAQMLSLTGGVREQISALAAEFRLRCVALTRGARGSLLFSEGQWFDHPGLPTKVVDTVGAGDAFTAELTFGLLDGAPLDTISIRANELAAYVCSQPGATPFPPMA